MQEAVNSAYNIALFYLIIYYLFIVYRKVNILDDIGSSANFRIHQDLPFCSICKIWSSRSVDT